MLLWNKVRWLICAFVKTKGATSYHKISRSFEVASFLFKFFDRSVEMPIKFQSGHDNTQFRGFETSRERTVRLLFGAKPSPAWLSIAPLEQTSVEFEWKY